MLTRRSRAREVALQLLFQKDQNSAVLPRKVLERFAHDRLANEERLKGSAELTAFALQLYDGVAAHQTTLDTHTLQITDLDGRVTTNTQDIASLDSRVTGLEASVEGGFARLDGRIDKAFEGAAMAMAMAAPAMPSDKNYAVSINWGGFEGQNAFAGTAQARISENFMVHGGIGLGSTGTVGGRAGLTYAW
ncbi:MAG: YadA-like family protein [Alphaproteobacteria bacterium]|nr:YadA-like family protein [Alphaproteobacteria bacterium]